MSMDMHILTPLWQWGLNLDLNVIERVIIKLIVPENYSFDTIISDYFYRLPFTTPLPLRVLEVHINDIRGIYFHITESKIHISYLRNHDLTLILSSIIFTCHPFQPSPISLLILGNTFSISSPFDVTKLQKNCLDVSLTGSFPFPVSRGTHILNPYQPYGDEESTWN